MSLKNRFKALAKQTRLLFKLATNNIKNKARITPSEITQKAVQRHLIQKEIKTTPMKSAAAFLFGTNFSATEKLKAFAYFPKAKNSSENGFFDSIAKLSQIALEETWGFGDDKSHRYSILHSFFKYTFERLVFEDEENSNNPNWKTKIRLSNNGRYALYNTGLVDQYFEPIFALFEKTDRNKNSRLTSKWVFKDFPNSKNNSMGMVYQHFGDDSMFPKPTNYLKQNNNSELIYNLNYSISESNNWDHIILDNYRRLPIDLLKKCELPFDFSRFDDPSINLDELQKELGEKLKNSHETCRQIKDKIKNATCLAEKRVHWNFKTAIPIYYPKTRKICLLLPLCLCDEKKADAALVLDPVNNTYIQRTILTLQLAYIDARLITRPDSDWLETSKIILSQENN